MNAIVEWANRNPVLIQVLVWPTLTALLTWAFKPRTPEEYQRMGRMGSVLKVLGALGIDVPVLLQGLKEIRTGQHQPASAYISARTIPPPSVTTPSDIPVTYEDDDTGSKGSTQ
jgi:hypothetical protein